MLGTLVLKPDWIAPLDCDPITLGCLVIENGRIAWIGHDTPERYRSCRTIQMPRCALLPGLINSHCHLEFSDIRNPIETGATFPDWIRSVVQYRRQQSESAVQDVLESREQAIRDGIDESYRSGVRWVVDMVTGPWDRNWVSHSIGALSSSELSEPITIQPCFEVLDINEVRRQQTFDFARTQLELLGDGSSRGIACPGLAPHAPYTASLLATRWAADLANNQSNGIISMHLAESLDELQWLAHRQGAFAEMLKPFVGHEYLSEMAPVEAHLQRMLTTRRSLVVHGNYLSEDAKNSIAENREHQAVVYCPRTHEYFRHSPYPLRELLDRGIRVFVGTDSRASNPDLSLWRELTAVFRMHPNVGADEILRMATIGPAEFLEIEGRVGSIRIGNPANLCAVTTNWSPIAQAGGGLLGALLSSDCEPAPLESVLDRFS